jgi:hypothetical protein
MANDRREQFGNSIPSPVKRYYTWGSDAKGFKWYDKSTGENKVEFPLSVAFITSRSTVRGWHDATESSIYSNEVKNTAQEALSVYSSKPDKKGNTLLATGIYKNIKGDLQGGHFEKVLYAYQEGVGVVKINLKGSSLQAFSNFEKENKAQVLFDNLLSITTFESAKKGATKYTVPNFTLGAQITKELDQLVNGAYTEVVTYLDSKGKSKDNVEEDTSVPEEAFQGVPAESDLPF